MQFLVKYTEEERREEEIKFRSVLIQQLQCNGTLIDRKIVEENFQFAQFNEKLFKNRTLEPMWLRDFLQTFK